MKDMDESTGMVEVPWDRLNPDTLRNVVSEFVTRDWEEIGLCSYTLDEKIEQVLTQLKTRRAALVYDPLSNTCNIIPTV
ncbi:YheU family protein [Geomonas propionica]|uniref:YheU family protein n=1 Tax=Geomonas propionica TaxID=2798582 RepID=A0ABS0YPN2_9BACT|nr:YheU family protein [Geomonas propionica]MBJ6799727.1 YheU family protein [Geomonas propionica]